MKVKALLLVSAIISITAATAFADVKIKTRQTVSGQSMENTTYIKGKRSRTEMANGMMTTITQCDLSRDLQLSSTTKTYMINNYDDGSSNAAPGAVNTNASAAVTKGGTMTVTTTIKDTGERKQMFGFTARHIVQTIETESTPDSCNPTKTKMEMDMWVIDAEFALTCDQQRTYHQYRASKAGGCQDKIVPKTIGSAKSGYPLWQKMTSFDANGKETFSTVSEVVELSKATLDQALFEVPADYREVKDAAQMYAVAAPSASSYNASSSGSNSSIIANNKVGAGSTGGYYPGSETPSGLNASVQSAINTKSDEPASATTAKKPGTIRLGLANVKTGSVGEGITAADLSAAIKASLGEFLKGTKVEVVPLEARLASAQADEAKNKECDFIINVTANHKKGGGGGFGFGKMLASTVAQTGIGHTGSVAGNIAGQVATTAIVTAGNLSGNVKAKDELTIDVVLQPTAGGNAVVSKQFKAKAQANGDDIITTVVEQAAQAIIDAVGR